MVKLGAHVGLRISIGLADKLTKYGYENDKNFSQSIIELVEFAFDIKPILKELKEDPKKINEILLEIEAKKSEKGMENFILSLPDAQQEAIATMIQMKRAGTWKKTLS